MELKPCPFCGDGAGYNSRREWNMDENHKVVTVSERYKIACRSCFCGTPWLFYEEDAVEMWNRRENDV
jgi:hypothetical protein